MTIAEIKNKIELGQNIVLYHGSKTGLDGEIDVTKGRIDCDFGQGFYLGTNAEQAMALVAKKEHPEINRFVLNFGQADKEKILVLEDMDWAYTVLSCRNNMFCKEFNELAIASEYKNRLKNYDIVIGAIADDRMNAAMRAFADYDLTDKGLFECLKYLDYGIQIVLKNNDILSCLTRTEHHFMSSDEIIHSEQYDIRMSGVTKNAVNEMKKKHRKDGKYLDEIVEEQLEKENSLKEEDEHDDRWKIR